MTMMSRLVKKIWCCGAKSFHGRSKEEDRAQEGHIRVYVGKDDEMLSKFEVEANYLNHPLFENLLEISEQEFGYSYEGALRIACEIDVFQHVIHLLDSNNPSAHYTELPQLMQKLRSSSNNGGRPK